MGNYSKVNVTSDARTELHDKLSLTGAEISINNLPAGVGVPFIHSHKNNEEIYAILSGSGKVIVEGESIELEAGDWIRIAPAAQRQFFAADDEGISIRREATAKSHSRSTLMMMKSMAAPTMFRSTKSGRSCPSSHISEAGMTIRTR